MAAIKTFVVLENCIKSNRNEPYSFFVFKSLRELRQCKEINEYSIVFSEVHQLEDTFSEEELECVVFASGGKHLDRYPSFYRNFAEYVAKRAKKYKPISKEVNMSATIVPLDQEVKTEPKAPRQSRTKYNPEAKIVVIGANPYRAESNRWHNFEALSNAGTVAEALTAMKALTPGGNSVDIRLALEKEAIKLEE